jgi:hypothetical protein
LGSIVLDLDHELRFGAPHAEERVGGVPAEGVGNRVVGDDVRGGLDGRWVALPARALPP